MKDFSYEIIRYSNEVNFSGPWFPEEDTYMMMPIIFIPKVDWLKIHLNNQ